MATLGIRIPDSQKQKIEEKVERKGYPNISEYVRELIRDDLEKEEIGEKVAREIKRRKEQVEDGEISLDDMRTMEQIVEEEELE